MNIETKFEFGDEVWLIHLDTSQVQQTCETCEGSGRLELANGKNLQCQICFGLGKGKWVTREAKWRIKGSYTLGQVCVTVRAEKTDGPDDSACNLGHQKYLRTEEYMAYETGIGTGHVMDVENLFADEEAALAECARCNRLCGPHEEALVHQQLANQLLNHP